MILVTHGLVGGAIGAASGSISIAVVTGFISHYVLDAIPHWDYPLSSLSGKAGDSNIKINKGGINKIDIYKVLTDGILGLLLPVLIAQYLDLDLLLVFLGAGFAILPDFLTFVYIKTQTILLKALTWFHIDFLQSKWRLDGKPVLGISLQAIVWILAVFGMFSV